MTNPELYGRRLDAEDIHIAETGGQYAYTEQGKSNPIEIDMNNSMIDMNMGNSINEGMMANKPKRTNIRVNKPKNLEFLI